MRHACGRGSIGARLAPPAERIGIRHRRKPRSVPGRCRRRLTKRNGVRSVDGGLMGDRRHPERRAPHRPTVGDVMQCPGCPRGRLEFTERNRGSLGAHTQLIPAWICDACAYVGPVRAEQQAATKRAAARGSVHAHRDAKEARDIRVRASASKKRRSRKRRRIIRKSVSESVRI